MEPRLSRAGLLALILTACCAGVHAFLAPAGQRAAILSPATRARARTLVMAESFDMTMPALSSTMTEGKIVQWTKRVGDKVQPGDVVMVVESDKVRNTPQGAWDQGSALSWLSS
jgi:biotin carboxyl carrier protein